MLIGAWERQMILLASSKDDQLCAWLVPSFLRFFAGSLLISQPLRDASSGVSAQRHPPELCNSSLPVVRGSSTGCTDTVQSCISHTYMDVLRMYRYLP
jgi:hypothetical protein